MSIKIKSQLLVAIWSIVLAVPAFAVHNFNTNLTFGVVGSGPVVTNWGFAPLWDGGLPTGDTTDINITNQFAQVTTITNAFSANNTALNFLRVISGNALLNSSNVTVLVITNFATNFGFQIGSNATVIIANTSTFGSNGNSAFDLGKTAAKGMGTLIISNGAGLFLNFNAAIRNDGTIIFQATGSQNSQINYGQNNGGTFTNNTGGVMVKLGNGGTGSMIGEFGGTSKNLLNLGLIVANGGAMRFDPRDAFSNGGVRNGATGLIQVNTNAVLEIRRTTNAWLNTNAAFPTNQGTIFMNGGELRTFDTDGGVPGTNTTRLVVNSATGSIRGNGLLDFTLRNEAAGTIEARDGTLTTVASANNNGNWVSTNFGNAVSVLNFAAGNFDLGGGTLLNSNGTLRVISGANATLSTSYRQNWGTIDFAGTASVFVANSASAGALTNESIIQKTGAGSALLMTGYGTDPASNNFGFANNGTIIAGGGGTLTVNPNNAFTRPFTNSPTGTIVIDASTAFRITRTATAWNSATLTTQIPINAGTITLNGGLLETADGATLATNRFILNTGRLQGNGTISASVSNLAGGVLSPGLSLGTNTVSGAVAIGSNATLAIELGSLSGQSDLLNITGTLALDANSILNITGGAPGNVYTASTFSARSGTFGTNSPGYSVTYGTGVIAIAPLAATHTIAASADPNGSIAPSGSVIVTNGDNQAFTITPNGCYQIADVLVDAISVGAVSSYTFTNVTTDHTISASFSAINYTITASAGANGSINPAGAVSAGCGTNYDFNITADPSYHIADVLVDSISVGPVSSYTFTNVAANHTISASFAIDTFNINATAGTGGTITPNGSVSVNSGANQGFTITADACYSIADVLVDSISVGPVNDYTFTNVVAGHTIDASFTLNTYTITATASANGTISPIGAVVVNCGTNQDFTITPDAGYPIVDVLVDALSVGSVSSYSFTNITANHTIDASFATELFRVQSIKREGDNVRITWPTAGGHSYVVQFTSGAGGSYSNDFTDLDTYVIPGTGESTTNHLDVGGATNNPARYYRIRLP